MSDVIFPERVLRPFAQPVTPSELQEGQIYFSVQFVDPEMLVPILEPLVFVGRDLVEGDTDTFYLQDLESYREGRRFESEGTDTTDAVFFRAPTDGLSHIFDFDHALDVLLACSLRRESNEAV